MSELYRDFIDGKADAIINSLGGTITPAPANAELYRDFLDRKFDDVITALNGSITPAPISDELYRDFIERKFDDVIAGIGGYVPPLSFPTLTGSIVTFNSQYAGLPLKSHTVVIDSVSGVSAINIGSDNKYAGFINYNQISPVKSAIETKLGITTVQSTDGTVILNGTTEGDYFFNCSSAISIPGGHKVFLCGCPTEGSYSTFYGKDGYTSSAYDVGEGAMILSKNTILYQILVKRGVTLDNVVFKPQIFDLTVMFGEGNEPETIEEFRALFSNDYYSYNSGELSTVSAVNGSTNSFFTIPIGQSVNEATYNTRTGVLEVTQPSVQTIQLPPCPIDTLEGVNNIWADTGNTTLQYIKIGGNT